MAQMLIINKNTLLDSGTPHRGRFAASVGWSRRWL